jgi:2'-5' RNA ligase
MIRTFVALDLPTATQQALAVLQEELRSLDASVSWVKSDRVHLTLKFLGSISAEQVATISEALLEVAARTAPFRLQPAGCGAFPTLRQMRIVWVGLRENTAELRTLHHAVEEALVPLGFAPEGRPFQAHLTLGRVRGKRHLQRLHEALLARRGFLAEAFDVREIVLYRSDLKPEGAFYTPLYRASFAGGTR